MPENQVGGSAVTDLRLKPPMMKFLLTARTLFLTIEDHWKDPQKGRNYSVAGEMALSKAQGGATRAARCAISRSGDRAIDIAHHRRDAVH